MKLTGGKNGFIIGLVAMLILLTIGCAGATTISVNASGGGADYASIQEAINNANAGDVIEVQSGIYLENVVVNKTLSLMGIGMPLVNASGNGTVLTIIADGSTVDGFNVTGSGTAWNGGDADSAIKIKSDDNTILNNTMHSSNYGMYVFESVNNTIENNSVYGNTEGVYLFYSSNNLILGNGVNSNTNAGVYLSNSNNCTISNNTVVGNTNGVYLSASSENSLLSNDANGNSNYGIYLNSYSDGNVLAGNNATGNINDGIYLHSSSSNTLTNNNATDNNDIGIYLVGSSSNTLTSNNAIGNSGEGFRLAISDSNNLINNNVTGNRGTGIDLSSSNSNTLTSNNAIGNNNNGIYVDGSINTLTNNSATNNNYGIYLSGSSNILINNNATGNNIYGIYLSGSSNILTNNSATNNNYGIYLSGSTGNTLIQNDVLSNGYGLYIYQSSNSNTLIKNNLIDNINYNAYDIVGSNSWAFNYYSDYTGSDSNKDGIGDATYYIAGDVGAQDSSPSMQSVVTNGNGASFTLNAGGIIPLYESYSLVLLQVDLEGTKALFEIQKDGRVISTDVVNKGESFSYIKSIGGSNRVILNYMLDDIFRGTDISFVNITNFYQISETGNTLLIADSSDLPNPSPSITLSSPPYTSVSDNSGDLRTFTITLNHISNITWILDGTIFHTNTSVTTASYHNSSAQAGMHNLTVVAKNVNGTDQKKWTWNVAAPPERSTAISPMTLGQTVVLSPDDIRIKIIEIDPFFVRINITSSTDTNGNVLMIGTGDTGDFLNPIQTPSGTLNRINVSVSGDSVVMTIYSNFDLTIVDYLGVPVVEEPTVPSITSFSPFTSSVSDSTGNPRTFTVTIDQIVNLIWILDGIPLYTNTSTTTASYHNSSAQAGVHNVTVVAENVNGTGKKEWAWTVTTPNTYTMTLLKGWNLVSIPITPDTPYTTSVFGSNSDVILPIYEWNTAGRQYYDASTIEIGKGYWILALNDTQVVITGTL